MGGGEPAWRHRARWRATFTESERCCELRAIAESRAVDTSPAAAAKGSSVTPRNLLRARQQGNPCRIGNAISEVPRVLSTVTMTNQAAFTTDAPQRWRAAPAQPARCSRGASTRDSPLSSGWCQYAPTALELARGGCVRRMRVVRPRVAVVHRSAPWHRRARTLEPGRSAARLGEFRMCLRQTASGIDMRRAHRAVDGLGRRTDGREDGNCGPKSAVDSHPIFRAGGGIPFRHKT